MDNIKDWNLLSESEKSYWILIHKGHSKLNGHDPVPEKYIPRIKGIIKLVDHQIKTGKGLLDKGGN